jgi:hypothetical protein
MERLEFPWRRINSAELTGGNTALLIALEAVFDQLGRVIVQLDRLVDRG